MCERGSAKAPLATRFFWKPDDAAQQIEPLRRLQDFPARKIAEAHFEDVEIERRIEIVAVGAIAVDVVDPGDDAAVIIDVIVDRTVTFGALAPAFT